MACYDKRPLQLPIEVVHNNTNTHGMETESCLASVGKTRSGNMILDKHLDMIDLNVLD